MTESASANGDLDIREIMQLLPHRYPFLLLDRVLECVPGERLAGVKNVTINEPFFQGHFPNYPVMPGVMILEALAQACGVLGFKTANQTPDDGSVYFFVGIDKARFRRPVVAGDQLLLEAKLLREVRGIWQFAAQARVDDQVVASAEIMCTLKEV